MAIVRQRPHLGTGDASRVANGFTSRSARFEVGMEPIPEFVR